MSAAGSSAPSATEYAQQIVVPSNPPVSTPTTAHSRTPATVFTADSISPSSMR